MSTNANTNTGGIVDSVATTLTNAKDYVVNSIGQSTHEANQQKHEEIAKGNVPGASVGDRLSSGVSAVTEGIKGKSDGAAAEVNKQNL